MGNLGGWDIIIYLKLLAPKRLSRSMCLFDPNILVSNGYLNPSSHPPKNGPGPWAFIFFHFLSVTERKMGLDVGPTWAFIFFHLLSSSFIFFHLLSSSFIFFHLLFLCIFWHLLASSGIFWHLLAFFGIFWHFLAFSFIFFHFVLSFSFSFSLLGAQNLIFSGSHRPWAASVSGCSTKAKVDADRFCACGCNLRLLLGSPELLHRAAAHPT